MANGRLFCYNKEEMKTYTAISTKLDFFGRVIRASYLELFLFWILMNVMFAAFYFLLSITHPLHGPNFPMSMGLMERLYDSFYFSVATTTTLGYGDIIPLGASKMLAVLQASVGLMVFTVFVGKLVSEGQKK
jgi:potassium channel LctB